MIFLSSIFWYDTWDLFGFIKALDVSQFSLAIISRSLAAHTDAFQV